VDKDGFENRSRHKHKTLDTMEVKNSMRRATFLFLVLLFTSCYTGSGDDEFNKVKFDNIELHYAVQGSGTPLILIHGSLADLRYWKEQTPFLEKHFQVITYSRRYNYPNINNPEGDHSAITEASDLLRLMDKLKLDRVHLLGHSYGAYTALWFALEHRERVNKLILAEPPLMKWLPDIPGGEGIEEQFMADVWTPIRNAFLEGGERGGLEFTSWWYFEAPLDSISSEWQTYLTDNAKEWHALAVSEDAYPMVNYEKVRNLNIPVLLMSGSRSTGNMNDLIDGHLARLIPDSHRVLIGEAGHEMFMDNPDASNRAIFNFLSANN
jgi:non-heme chloroperoxidase